VRITVLKQIAKQAIKFKQDVALRHEFQASAHFFRTIHSWWTYNRQKINAECVYRRLL